MTTTTPSDGQKSENNQGASTLDKSEKNGAQEPSRKFMNYEMVSVELSTLRDMVPRLRKEIRTYAVNENQYMRELEKKLPHCRGIGEIRMQMTIDQIDRLREHKISALDELAQLSAKITELEYRKERNSYEAGEVQWNTRLTELASQYCSFSSPAQSQTLGGLEFRSHSFSSKSYGKYGRMTAGGDHGIDIGSQRDSITKGALVNMGTYQANEGSPTTETPFGNNSASNNFMQLMIQSREIAENRLRAEKIRQAVPGIGKPLLVEKDRIIFGEDGIVNEDHRNPSADSDKKSADVERLGQEERMLSKKILKKKIAISIIVPSVLGAIIAFELETELLRKTLGGLLFG